VQYLDFVFKLVWVGTGVGPFNIYVCVLIELVTPRVRTNRNKEKILERVTRTRLAINFVSLVFV
jgi:hypothetical protein